MTHPIKQTDEFANLKPTDVLSSCCSHLNVVAIFKSLFMILPSYGTIELGDSKVVHSQHIVHFKASLAINISSLVNVFNMAQMTATNASSSCGHYGVLAPLVLLLCVQHAFSSVVVQVGDSPGNIELSLPYQ